MREGICMEKITVWTKQHKAVLETLEREGRYVAKRQFVEYENEDCAPLVLEVYDWLVKNGPNASQKPQDAGLSGMGILFPGGNLSAAGTQRNAGAESRSQADYPDSCSKVGNDLKLFLYSKRY